MNDQPESLDLDAASEQGELKHLFFSGLTPVTPHYRYSRNPFV